MGPDRGWLYSAQVFRFFLVQGVFVKVEPVLAKLNALRQDTKGEGGVEEKAIYHAFCFISYEVGPFTDYVESGTDPNEKKGVEAGDAARTLFAVLEELREDVADDEADMEFIALDKAVGFISKAIGDFQHYLNETAEVN